MKKTLTFLALVAVLPVVHGATTYTDATGENHDGNAHMDISSVDVDNTSTTITFTVNLSGLVIFPNDWGKYVVGITTSSATGGTGSPVGNPWGRNINMADGMDAWIGTFVNDGATGAQAWTHGGGSWTQNTEIAPTIADDSVSFTFNLSDHPFPKARLRSGFFARSVNPSTPPETC